MEDLKIAVIDNGTGFTKVSKNNINKILFLI